LEIKNKMAEINLLHRYPPAKRNFTERGAATEEDKRIARQYGYEYFDGPRIQGYGGYRYDGRWIPIAETICSHWNLKAGDKVLDIGCAKGFLVKDLMIVCPGLEVFGVDISEYAIEHAEPEVKGRVQVANANKLPFPDNSFKAAIAINVLHNLDRENCIKAIREMVRVAPEKGYIQVDSYRTREEEELFLTWVLTAKTHYYAEGWKELFNEAGYKGDYYWTFV